MSGTPFSLREAFGGAGDFLATVAGFMGRPRLAPVEELVLVQEFADNAKRALPAATFAVVAPGSRSAFDRITFRPEAFTPTVNLDLGLELFGQKLFTPIMVGSIADQRRFHPEAELATAQGCSAARAVMVVSSRSRVPVEQITASNPAVYWYHVHLEPGAEAGIRRAAKAGCKAVCIAAEPGHPIDWAGIDRLRKAADLPFLVKGITLPDEAHNAVRRGLQGIVVASGPHGESGTAPIRLLPSVVDVVEGKIPVLIDTDFQLGGDVLKALAYGATAAFVTRPAMWGLAAYGAPGVQAVIELMQCDLARAMCMAGRIDLAAVNRSMVKLHATPYPPR